MHDVYECVWGSQRTTCGSQLSPAVWVPEIELKLSNLAAEPSHQLNNTFKLFQLSRRDLRKKT